MARPRITKNSKPAKVKLLEASFELIRSKGYTATTVDDLCKKAGVTNGTFFHYFDTKEALAVEAANHWSVVTGEFFRSASYHGHDDPLERLLGYIEFRKQIISGATSEFTCLVGTMVQEIYDSHPAIRQACKDSVYAHAEKLESDISELKQKCAPKAKWSAQSLALYTQAVLQGGFILAKTGDGAKVAEETIDHLINYINLLFNQKPKKENKNV